MAQKSIDNRINNIIGQLRAIKRMIAENDPDCTKIVIQLKAAKAATASMMEAYLHENLQVCLHSSKTKDKELVNKLVAEIIK